MESWEPDLEPLNLCPVEEAEPPILAAAVEELRRAFATEGLTATAKVQRGTVELGGKCLEYSIRTSAGATRRRIRVTPNGIEVVIPRSSELTNVAAFLRETKGWVLEQLDFVERSAGLIRRESRPSSLLLRGEERSIRVEEEVSTRRYGIVTETGGELIVRVPKGKVALASRALELWLRRLARGELTTVLDRRAREMKLKFGRVYIMSQRTRWGGCSSRRKSVFQLEVGAGTARSVGLF